MLQLSINNGNAFINIDNWVVMPQSNSENNAVVIAGTVGKYTLLFRFIPTEVSATYPLHYKQDKGSNFVVLACEAPATINEYHAIDCLQYLSFHNNATIDDWRKSAELIDEFDTETALAAGVMNEEIDRVINFPIYTFHLTSSVIVGYPAN